MNVESVARDIARGGGVYEKALIVGPRQDRWLLVLEHVDRDEVERAVRMIVAGSSSLTRAGEILNVEPDFLFRYKLPPCAKRDLVAGRFVKYRSPRTKADALPIVRARVEQTGKGGAGSGAWRISDLLDDPKSKNATLEALAEVLSPCATITDVAQTLGVTRALVWQWRKTWPEFDALVEKKRGVASSGVALKKNGRRRLTLEEAIDLVRPYLPGTATEVLRKIEDAAEKGGGVGVVPRPRELSFYTGRPDSRGLMISRTRMRWGKDVPYVWTLVDTKTGERVDVVEEKGTNGKPKKKRPR